METTNIDPTVVTTEASADEKLGAKIAKRLTKKFILTAVVTTTVVLALAAAAKVVMTTPADEDLIDIIPE